MVCFQAEVGSASPQGGGDDGVVAGDADGGVGGEDEVDQSGGQLAVALPVQGDVDAVGRLQGTSCRVTRSVDGRRSGSAQGRGPGGLRRAAGLLSGLALPP